MLLKLNAGLRYDINRGGFPDYKRLEIGEPSISPSGQYKETDVTIPGFVTTPPDVQTAPSPTRFAISRISSASFAAPARGAA